MILALGAAPEGPSPAAPAGRSATGTVLGRFAGRRVPLLAVAAVILALSWPVTTSASLSLDLHWIVGLHRAAQIGLRFGQDVVFTYGPLGILGLPTPFLGGTSALAFAATLLVYLAAVWLLATSLRRHVPLWAAAALALLLARTFFALTAFDAAQFAIFAAGVWLLRRGEPARPVATAVVAGVIAAVAVLAKLNIGVFAAAMAVVAIAGVSARPRRDVALTLVSFAAATGVLWLVAGQPLADLIAYGRSSLDVISGYSEAMGSTKPTLAWTYPVFAAVAAVALVAAWRSSMGWPLLRRLALGALVALLVFATWKSGYVRFHVAEALLILSLAAVVLLPDTLPRPVPLVAVGAVVVVLVAVTRVGPGTLADAPSSVRNLLAQARNAAAVWNWDAEAERTRATLAAELPLPPSILQALTGHTVDFDPLEDALAAAYPQLAWRPLPVLQTYSAYTPLLDDIDANLLRSADRPERILRHASDSTSLDGRTGAGSIDGRFYWFESPAATVERVCRYREVAASGDWQVLADTHQACGAPVPMGTVQARAGDTVPVPAAPQPGGLVVVKVLGVNAGVAMKVRTTLWRSPTVYVLLNGVRYRLVPGTASQGLLLSVPTDAQGSPPFQFGPPVRTISIVDQGGGGGDLTYQFYELPMAAP